MQNSVIIISILTIIYIIRKIRKHKLNIDDSIVWIIWSIILLILSIFPKISIFFAYLCVAFLWLRTSNSFCFLGDAATASYAKSYGATVCI